MNAGLSASPAIGGEFRLRDHYGRKVSNETYLGRYVLVFFGFTHCRVVCPRALTRLSGVLDRLGSLADCIQPLYVTVDPERDNPDVMRVFLNGYPRFTGLTGSRAQIDDAKSAFRVFARRTADPADPDGYAVPHTAIAYLMNREGQYVEHFTDARPADEIVTRLRSMLAPASTVGSSGNNQNAV